MKKDVNITHLLKDMDRYIQTMHQNQGHPPSAIWLTKPQYRAFREHTGAEKWRNVPVKAIV